MSFPLNFFDFSSCFWSFFENTGENWVKNLDKMRQEIVDAERQQAAL